MKKYAFILFIATFSLNLLAMVPAIVRGGKNFGSRLRYLPQPGSNIVPRIKYKGTVRTNPAVLRDIFPAITNLSESKNRKIIYNILQSPRPIVVQLKNDLDLAISLLNRSITIFNLPLLPSTKAGYIENQNEYLHESYERLEKIKKNIESIGENKAVENFSAIDFYRNLDLAILDIKETLLPLFNKAIEREIENKKRMEIEEKKKSKKELFWWQKLGFFAPTTPIFNSSNLDYFLQNKQRLLRALEVLNVIKNRAFGGIMLLSPVYGRTAFKQAMEETLKALEVRDNQIEENTKEIDRIFTDDLPEQVAKYRFDNLVRHIEDAQTNIILNAPKSEE